MGKRFCPFQDTDHIEKQQITSQLRSRKIRSSISEKTLQLLYKGANKNDDELINNRSGNNENKDSCCLEYGIKKCWYCNKELCNNCFVQCNLCNEDFCNNCSFHLYESGNNTCYSCF